MDRFHLPKNYSHNLQGFDDQLAAIAASLASDPAEMLMEQGQTLQNYFQAQIQPLDADLLPGEQRSRFRAIQTELHRHMRLLQTDFLFLRNAQQASTAVQRRGQVGDRLASLRGFCAGLLQGSEGASPEFPA